MEGKESRGWEGEKWRKGCYDTTRSGSEGEFIITDISGIERREGCRVAEFLVILVIIMESGSLVKRVRDGVSRQKKVSRDLAIEEGQNICASH